MAFLVIVLSEKFKYLGNGTIFFWTDCVEIYQTLASIKHVQKLTKWTNFDAAASVGIVPGSPEMAHLYTRRGTWSAENQKANILKIAANSYGALVLSSKARAHKLLINERKPGHNVRGVSMTYEISLYRLPQPKLILSVSVCRVLMAVYTYTISGLITLLLNNGEIYNI